MKVFLDTNVILDWILAREHAFGLEAKEIIQHGEQSKLELYMSGGSVYTLAYVIEKAGLKNHQLNQTLLKILNLINVVPDCTNFYEDACLSPFNDLEDAFQYRIAKSNNKINFFITGNTKDFVPFVEKMLPVLNPKEFLELVG